MNKVTQIYEANAFDKSQCLIDQIELMAGDIKGLPLEEIKNIRDALCRVSMVAGNLYFTLSEIVKMEEKTRAIIAEENIKASLSDVWGRG